MNRRISLSLCAGIFLSSCVQAPVYKGESYALIKSYYPIVSVNGVEVSPVYELDLKSGKNSLVIVYPTYQYNYFCSFSWTSVAGTAYEVIDQENRFPLTLYRWVATNSLWVSRLDPIDPLKCAVE